MFVGPLLFMTLSRSRTFILPSLIVASSSAFTLNNQLLPHHHSFLRSHLFQLRSISQIDSVNSETLHQVQGIECREVQIHLDVVGPVVILEATADSQNDLVDMALLTEEELDSMSSDGDKLRLTSGDPYGAVLWPAASAVANHLLTAKDLIVNGKTLQEMTILELGAGTGLVSIAAALGGVPKIMATDYESVPLQLLNFAASNLNLNEDGSSKDITSMEENRREKLSNIDTFLFDICNHDESLPLADLVVAADIMYEPTTGIAMAYRVVEALKAGSRVIVGCSPGRYVHFHEWID